MLAVDQGVDHRHPHGLARGEAVGLGNPHLGQRILRVGQRRAGPLGRGLLQAIEAVGLRRGHAGIPAERRHDRVDGAPVGDAVAVHRAADERDRLRGHPREPQGSGEIGDGGGRHAGAGFEQHLVGHHLGLRGRDRRRGGAARATGGVRGGVARPGWRALQPVGGAARRRSAAAVCGAASRHFAPAACGAALRPRRGAPAPLRRPRVGGGARALLDHDRAAGPGRNHDLILDLDPRPRAGHDPADHAADETPDCTPAGIERGTARGPHRTGWARHDVSAGARLDLRFGAPDASTRRAARAHPSPLRPNPLPRGSVIRKARENGGFVMTVTPVAGAILAPGWVRSKRRRARGSTGPARARITLGRARRVRGS
jgi:hypothetical protein